MSSNLTGIWCKAERALSLQPPSHFEWKEKKQKTYQNAPYKPGRDIWALPTFILLKPLIWHEK